MTVKQKLDKKWQKIVPNALTDVVSAPVPTINRVSGFLVDFLSRYISLKKYPFLNA